MDENLKQIRAAYYNADRHQPPEYSPLSTWESLPMQMREMIIHVWHEGHRAGAQYESDQRKRIERR
jgi:hypothetical protein